MSKSKNKPKKIKKDKPGAIYIHTGDKGLTTLYDGRQIAKNHFRINTFGTIEELNSYLALILFRLRDERLSLFIKHVQKDLLIIGDYLIARHPSFGRIVERIREMETVIDEVSPNLSVTKRHVFPEGTESSIYFFIARALSRRIERELVALSLEDAMVDKRLLIYFNRLSDLFLVSARYLNYKAGMKK